MKDINNNVNDNEQKAIDEMIEVVEEISWFEAHKKGLIIAGVAIGVAGAGLGLYALHKHNEKRNNELYLEMMGESTDGDNNDVQVTEF